MDGIKARMVNDFHMGGIGANDKSISFCVVNQYQYGEPSLAGDNAYMVNVSHFHPVDADHLYHVINM